jgi:hypothetical protein
MKLHPAPTPQGRIVELAEEIRALGKKTIHNIAGIGRRLDLAKTLVGHGNWHAWLEKEFGWTDRTALNFMRVHELGKSANFSDLNLAPSSLYLLGAPGTPDDVRDAVITRSQAGETFKRADVKRMIAAKVAPARSMQPPKPRPVPRPPAEMNDDCGLYVAPADKYFAMQEAKLGPIAQSVNIAHVPKSGGELKTILKGHRRRSYRG